MFFNHWIDFTREIVRKIKKGYFIDMPSGHIYIAIGNITILKIK
jgi:hypothetical protein